MLAPHNSHYHIIRYPIFKDSTYRSSKYTFSLSIFSVSSVFIFNLATRADRSSIYLFVCFGCPRIYFAVFQGDFSKTVFKDAELIYYRPPLP
jgi:hypothetical protein